MDVDLLGPIGLAVGALLGSAALAREIEKAKKEAKQARVPVPVREDEQQRRNKRSTR